jgi:hypothetical protein
MTLLIALMLNMLFEHQIGYQLLDTWIICVLWVFHLMVHTGR